MNTVSLVEEFKAITGEISEDEALKFLAMGKGNLTLSLNYFFNAKNKKKALNCEKSAFSELMEASKNQSKLEKIFTALKNEYSKPIGSSIPAEFSENQRVLAQEEKKRTIATLDLNIGGFQGNNNSEITAKKEEKKSVYEHTEPKIAKNNNGF